MYSIRKNSDLHPFSSFLDHFLGNESANFKLQSSRVPAVNIEENEKAYKVLVQAPGFKKDQFRIEIEQDVLQISGDWEEKSESHESNLYRREFANYSFQRSFQLPKNKVDESKIKAQYEDGILSIELPKRDEAQSRPSKLISIS